MLITEAPINVEDEFDHRRRRYVLTMSVRILCLIAAVATYQVSGWLALAFVVGAMVLPWCAVLIANDRPPKKELQFRRFVPGVQAGPRQLTDGSQPTAGEPDPEPTPRIIDL
ncbi:MAG TPA: DUF3099 domain-containing protein [Jatrophihabitans sp.]|nr:DUF3099 domain-containing protein [Jatrophihabitans sp.]